jgi:hypothetical protein
MRGSDNRHHWFPSSTLGLDGAGRSSLFQLSLLAVWARQGRAAGTNPDRCCIVLTWWRHSASQARVFQMNWGNECMDQAEKEHVFFSFLLRASFPAVCLPGVELDQPSTHLLHVFRFVALIKCKVFMAFCVVGQGTRYKGFSMAPRLAPMSYTERNGCLRHGLVCFWRKKRAHASGDYVH